VKYVDYVEGEVVKLVGHYGYSTYVKLNQDEKLITAVMGDKDAWKVAAFDYHIFMKPTKQRAQTNLTVLTNKRVYNFELTPKTSPNYQHSDKMYFQVVFRYPEEEKRKKDKELERSKIAERLDMYDAPGEENRNYWAKGSGEVTPNEIYDDGRFTFVKFGNNRDMPAIYTVDPKTQAESLVNTNINPDHPDTIIIHRVAPQFVFRRGTSVACIFNESYDLNGGFTNTNGTTIPRVKRTVIGQEEFIGDRSIFLSRSTEEKKEEVTTPPPTTTIHPTPEPITEQEPVKLQQEIQKTNTTPTGVIENDEGN
jgi:type IV secretion system protein VirB9